MKKLFILILLFYANVSFSQHLFTPALLSIPDSLIKNADAVIQFEEMQVEVASTSRMTIKMHNIVTILNKDGLRHSKINIGVDKFYKLDEISIKVYNNLGLEVSHFRKKDMKLEGAYDGITLASDSKTYTLDFPVPDLPCTVETEYEMDVSGYIDIPSWTFGSTRESLRNSRFIVKSALPIQYKIYNSSIQPVISSEGNVKVYRWELSNQTVPEREPRSYGVKSFMPWVDISPAAFSYDGYAGSLTSWKEFGKWNYPFYEETNPFTAERVAYFKDLIKNDQTEKEKISTLYHYLQKETRYVSIQFGIGGFKPFPVAFAEAKKYGDCKGLTHYMKNILQAVGIKSYAALINAGNNQYPVDPQFASSNFNHVILFIPGNKDTTWLECTSNLTPAGIPGGFTENRYALVITENGGVLVQTPTSKSSNNQWLAKTKSEVFEDGSGLVQSRIFVSGEYWENMYYSIESKTKDEIKKSLVNQFGYKAPDNFELKIIGDSAGGHIIELKLAYTQFFDFKAGSKHFFPLRPYKLNEETIKPVEIRKYDYLFEFPYIKTDTTIIQLAANFKKENLPQPKELKNEFVYFRNEVLFNETNRELTLITKLELRKHIVPAAQYNTAASSFELIKKEETQKMVLKKE